MTFNCERFFRGDRCTFFAPQTWPNRHCDGAWPRLSRCSSRKNSPASVSSCRRAFLLRHWDNPPSETGCAAPMVVAGAIAATLAAMVMKQPALVAVAPVGATYTTIGTGDPRKLCTIVLRRIEQAAGRVKLNDKTLCVLRLGLRRCCAKYSSPSPDQWLHRY